MCFAKDLLGPMQQIEPVSCCAYNCTKMLCEGCIYGILVNHNAVDGAN